MDLLLNFTLENRCSHDDDCTSERDEDWDWAVAAERLLLLVFRVREPNRSKSAKMLSVKRGATTRDQETRDWEATTMRRTSEER